MGDSMDSKFIVGLTAFQRNSGKGPEILDSYAATWCDICGMSCAHKNECPGCLLRLQRAHRNWQSCAFTGASCDIGQRFPEPSAHPNQIEGHNVGIP